jgi:glycosyltransferase involved in cell wall biosynthesis
MPKIALIVEPSFLKKHWGVRVYVYSLGKVLQHHGWTVDFVYPEASVSAEPRWHKLHLRDSSLFSAAQPSAAGRPAEVWKALREVAFKTGGPAPDSARPMGVSTVNSAGWRQPPVMPIGSRLEFEQYDVALITNPWMVRWRERLPARKTMGLVLDMIPELFGVLLDDGKPFAFAHQHETGYKYYEEFCDEVLTISDHTRDMYLELVRARRPGGVGPEVTSLPLFAPYSALGVSDGASPSIRAARLALAGCFDLRKGLRELPVLLNGLSDVLEEVVVYGGPRCRQGDVEAFFNNLRIDRIVWYLGATSDQVRDTFRRSKVLLFPSKYEGLGLPLLEAQLDGCRVATYPLSPMKDLALNGAVMLSDDASVSVDRLRHALQEPFDHANLQARARATFVEPVLRADPLGQVLKLDQTSRGNDATLRLAFSL